MAKECVGHTLTAFSPPNSCPAPETVTFPSGNTYSISPPASIREEEIPITTSHLPARLSARSRVTLRPSHAFNIAALLLILGLAGCGGGGSSNNNNPPPTPGTTTLSGTVTDLTGSAIVGATVSTGNQSTRTTQFGTFLLPNVPLPTGQSSVIQTVTASAGINGQTWNGQNTVEILTNETNTRNVQIIISNASTQGAIAGIIRDNAGNPVQGARVFAAAPDPAQAARFTSLGSFMAVTAADGSFIIPKLPPLNAGTNPTGYVVTASFAGYTNQSASVQVNPKAVTNIALTLTASSTGASLQTVQNFSALSITTPTTFTRAPGGSSADRALNALRHFILEKRGLLRHHAADPTRITRRGRVIRSTPSGSVIESDLFWDYTPLDNLLGYDVLRSANDASHFASIALLRDPLADRFADIDPALTPDTTYYYSVARLDTVNFPKNGDEGPPATPVAVDPLQPLALSSPNNAATAGNPPTFSWTSVNRAALYQILVYDRFPDYQSDTDPNGVRPIWPADPQNPGASLVSAPATSQTYQGPALTSGHTYYWAVLAQDDVGSAYSVSPVRSFIAP